MFINKKIHRILITLIFVLSFNTTAFSDSFDNLRRSISILAEIGETYPGDTQKIARLYTQAYEIGNNYKTRELRKKLGSGFIREWKKALKAVKVMSNYYKKYEKLGKGKKMGSRDISKARSAMKVIQDFRSYLRG